MDIPKIVYDDEKLVRVIFSPMNVNPKTQHIYANLFKSPPNKDEVSVLRLFYTNADFCKTHGKRIQIPNKKRNFYGFAVIDTQQVRSVEADVVSSPDPTNNLEMHADIKVDYVSIPYKNFPPEIKYKIGEMKRIARYYPDPNPESNRWEGDDLM
ncbi:MAG: hypothetical protein IIA88_08935 [Bacteroidetes bacterium]|nr:hypothetical protein [Bacteroidota bacterium]